MKKIFLLVLLALFYTNYSFAQWQKPEADYKNTYHYDLAEEQNDYYGQYLSIIFALRDSKERKAIAIMPFAEFRRNLYKARWERQTYGLELGAELIKGIYVGSTIQESRFKETFEDEVIINNAEYQESVTKLCLSHSFIKNNKFNLIGFILEEYTYNFDKKEFWRNELTAGIKVPIMKWIETEIAWSHLDRVNLYDSDAIEGSVTLKF